MLIFIDGYNLIKQSRDFSLDILVSKIKIYKKIKNHEIMIFMDGGDSPWSFEIKKFDIPIIYSGYQKSADQVIIEYSNKLNKFEILLVSSDNDLCKILTDQNIISMESKVFIELLKFRLEDNNKNNNVMINKFKHENESPNDELDYLMSHSPVFDKDNFINLKKKNKESIFKIDSKNVNKKLIKILNKL